MVNQAVYVSESRPINFNNLSNADRQLLSALHASGIGRGDFTCVLDDQDTGIAVTLKRSRLGNFFGAHYPGEAHDHEHDQERESIEHTRMKDYWARAATDVGLDVVTELSLPGGGIIDVVITGGNVSTDIEVQHTPKTASVITKRTRIYAAAGYLPVWFHVSANRPQWLRTVPYVGSSITDWTSTTPQPGSVRATGLGQLHEVRCDVTAFGGGCPLPRRRKPCGGIHPRITAGVTAPVEQTAEMIAAGELVPLLAWHDNVFIVRKAAFRRFQEMTEGLGEWQPAATTTTSRPAALSQAGPCGNSAAHTTAGQVIPNHLLPDRPVLVPPVPGQCSSPACAEPARLYADGWRCDRHKPRSRWWDSGA